MIKKKTTSENKKLKKTKGNLPSRVVKQFVDKEKNKKKLKIENKLKLVDNEDAFDTITHWIFNNTLFFLVIFSLVGYWSYLRVEDYLENRKIRIEAEAKLETITQRTKIAEKKIETFKLELEKAKIENIKLRSEIEKLSPQQKKKIIEEQIDNLKLKLYAPRDQTIGDKIKSSFSLSKESSNE